MVSSQQMQPEPQREEEDRIPVEMCTEKIANISKWAGYRERPLRFNNNATLVISIVCSGCCWWLHWQLANVLHLTLTWESFCLFSPGRERDLLGWDRISAVALQLHPEKLIPAFHPLRAGCLGTSFREELWSLAELQLLLAVCSQISSASSEL